jgi:hypothetical protein
MLNLVPHVYDYIRIALNNILYNYIDSASFPASLDNMDKYNWIQDYIEGRGLEMSQCMETGIITVYRE